MLAMLSEESAGSDGNMDPATVPVVHGGGVQKVEAEMEKKVDDVNPTMAEAIREQLREIEEQRKARRDARRSKKKAKGGWIKKFSGSWL